MKTFRKICALALLLALIAALPGCGILRSTVDYSSEDNWAYFASGAPDAPVDVFFICPTVYMGEKREHSMSLSDEDAREKFVGAINMEKGIYDANSRFFAPYYRQAALNVYTMRPRRQEVYLNRAFQDVKDSFLYYYEHYNEGRPILLAGFSQGADMCIRLLKECFKEEEMQDQLVACYAIGWRVTSEELAKYPQLKFAQGEDDTGVIIAFNSEAESVSDSLIVPKGSRTLAINPLNWKTDGTYADKRLNLGACLTDSDGNIEVEINHLTGAYIDDVRGVLKVPDVTSEDYPPALDIFPEGVYHVYDYRFFYRNLQKNVRDRILAYQQKRINGEAA